ncbi:MAG: hypothetical protein A2174_01815 [Candidatus Portnoybacteria bacterium RBG_13_41_18]|uniref:Uncharacterized protein n=1 Tax=Candidatus Portnoybacteria bacterium RBG_13_41_18 TaxID=1801991 RepID=A0A1G2F668_9BACT|nr:MAG: hypothetical protein A2174_01815 [Candidatus Portnoybacteria bacterium RBG_13_41_18]
MTVEKSVDDLIGEVITRIELRKAMIKQYKSKLLKDKANIFSDAVLPIAHKRQTTIYDLIQQRINTFDEVLKRIDDIMNALGKKPIELGRLSEVSRQLKQLNIIVKRLILPRA